MLYSNAAQGAKESAAFCTIDSISANENIICKWIFHQLLWFLCKIWIRLNILFDQFLKSIWEFFENENAL